MRLAFTSAIEVTTCASCGVQFGLPENLIAKRKSDGEDFYCPNGHRLSFGESEADKLRRERDRLTQRLAQKDDEVAEQRRYREQAERQVSAARGQITKLKKRASAGVCPCCNRTFSDLARHMSGQHPTFVKEPDDAQRVLQ